MNRYRTLAIAAALLVATGAGLGVGLDSGDPADERRRAVAERGAQVMPFDLDATTHRFVKTADGGRQIVVADDPDDSRQVELIRQHLQEEARAFARGEFDDPAAIHGSEMPGLDTLRNAGDRLALAVADRPDGAQLAYRTKDAAVRRALHAWFDAQVSDHGAHAQEH